MKSTFFIILSILFFAVNSLTSSQIEYIIDAGANGTSPAVDLSIVDEEFVFFSFDFDYHSQLIPDSKDTAFFNIHSDFDLIKDKSVGYLLDEKNWTQIDIKDIRNKTWKETKIMNKEKNNDITNYYYKFNRDNEKIKTLLLRVATNGVKKGYLYVENISGIPSGKSAAGFIHITKLICLFLFILNLW